jgi:hypothetical protein
MRVLSFVAVSAVALLVASAASSQPTVTSGQLGSWHGPWHDVPAASCHPHCDPNSGDDHDYEDDVPSNVLVDATKPTVECSGHNGCVFDPTSASVDNANHKVYIKIRSRSEPVRVRAVVPIIAVTK